MPWARIPGRGTSNGPHLSASAARRKYVDNRSQQEQRRAARRDARRSEDHSIRRGAAGGLNKTPFLPTSSGGGADTDRGCRGGLTIRRQVGRQWLPEELRECGV